MNKYTSITLTFFLISALSSQAQNQPMNRLSTGVFAYESIDEAINNGSYFPVFLNKLYYQREIGKNLHGVIGIDFENKLIDDNCKDCADQFYGIGNFKEAGLLLGIINEVDLKFCTRFKPLVGVDLSYARSNYSGEFSGGFWAQGYTFDNSYDKFGVAGDIGISFEPYTNLVITSVTSLRFSEIIEKRKLENVETTYGSLKWIPIEILLGVKF